MRYGLWQQSCHATTPSEIRVTSTGKLCCVPHVRVLNGVRVAYIDSSRMIVEGADAQRLLDESYQIYAEHGADKQAACTILNGGCTTFNEAMEVVDDPLKAGDVVNLRVRVSLEKMFTGEHRFVFSCCDVMVTQQ